MYFVSKCTLIQAPFSISTSELNDASVSTINGAIHWLNTRIGFYMGDNWPGDKVNISATKVLMGKTCTIIPVIFLWFCKLRKINIYTQNLH
jgi:hypothetical protein